MVVPFEAPTAQAVPGSAAAVAPPAEKTVRRRAEEEEPRLANHPIMPLFAAFVILASVAACGGADDGAEVAAAGKRQCARIADTPVRLAGGAFLMGEADRSEEHTSEIQSLMSISYAVFCLNKQTNNRTQKHAK